MAHRDRRPPLAVPALVPLEMSPQNPPPGSPAEPRWDGTRWRYPGPEPSPQPPGAPVDPSRMHRARRRSYLVGTAIALALAVVLGVAMIAVRGHQTNGPAPASSAQALFELPYARGVHSADFRVQYTSRPMSSASGVIEFAPEHSFSETLRVGTGVSQSWVQVHGVAYWSYSGSQYQAQDSEVDPFRSLGWDGSPASDRLATAGQTKFDGQPAWILKNSDTGEKWVVAEHNGDPLEAVINTIDSGWATYTFSDWGRAPAIHAPAAGDVSTERYRGAGTTPVVAPAARVRVLKAQPDKAGDGDPAGVRRVAIEFSYQNTSPFSSSVDPSLVSADGVFAETADPSLSPDVTGSSVPLGKVVTGWGGFIVPRQATSFHLLFGPGGDQAGADYLISISVQIPA